MPSLTRLLFALTLSFPAVQCAATATCVAGPIPGTICEAQCGVTHPGGDYSAIPASTFQACANACSSDSRCVTAQFDNKRLYCYLKHVINQAATSSTVDTVLCRVCPTENFRVQVITPRGDVRYLFNTGEIDAPAKDGQTSAYAYKSYSTVYYLNGTALTGLKPEADGARALVYTLPGDGVAYALTPARNVNFGYDLLQVTLAPAVDKCNVLFRTSKGTTTPAIYYDIPGGGVAFYIQSASSTEHVPVRAVYAIAA